MASYINETACELATMAAYAAEMAVYTAAMADYMSETTAHTTETTADCPGIATYAAEMACYMLHQLNDRILNRKRRSTNGLWLGTHVEALFRRVRRPEHPSTVGQS